MGMVMNRKEGIQKEVVEGWRVFINNLEKGLDMLEEDIDEAAKMADACTLEWCQAVEHVIDELSNSLYSISEPSWSSDKDSKKIKELRKRLHDLYAKYKSTARI
jgi:hemerythrin-like domain-containing protein